MVASLSYRSTKPTSTHSASDDTSVWTRAALHRVMTRPGRVFSIQNEISTSCHVTSGLVSDHMVLSNMVVDVISRHKYVGFHQHPHSFRPHVQSHDILSTMSRDMLYTPARA